MSLLPRVISGICTTINRYTTIILQQQTSHFHSLTSDAASQVSPGGSFSIAIRNKVRVYFPRPSERKRIKRHGFWQRMKTPAGRRVLINRILKGRWVISH